MKNKKIIKKLIPTVVFGGIVVSSLPVYVFAGIGESLKDDSGYLADQEDNEFFDSIIVNCQKNEEHKLDKIDLEDSYDKKEDVNNSEDYLELMKLDKEIPIYINGKYYKLDRQNNTVTFLFEKIEDIENIGSFEDGSNLDNRKSKSDKIDLEDTYDKKEDVNNSEDYLELMELDKEIPIYSNGKYYKLDRQNNTATKNEDIKKIEKYLKSEIIEIPKQIESKFDDREDLGNRKRKLDFEDSFKAKRMINKGQNEISKDMVKSSKTTFMPYKKVIKKVVIGNDVEKIGEEAFQFDNEIEEVKIPGNVREIGYRAFYNCCNLKKVIIEDGVKTIKASSFNGCAKLEEIIIPDSVETIESGAFKNCINLSKVMLGAGVRKIDEEAFAYCLNLKEAIIEDGVRCIGARVFEKCKNLKEIIIPHSVDIIEKETFYDCENLEEAIIEDGVRCIGARVFKNCKNLKRIKIPHSVNQIEEEAFYGCKNLEKVIIKMV